MSYHPETDTDVLVIGAGASGLMAAAEAGGAGARVIMIDGNDRAGHKLYATGNGRCNLTNLQSSEAEYNGRGDGFVKTVLSAFPVEATLSYFREAGLLIREEQEGRCYPYSGQAAAVAAVLERRAAAAGVVFRAGSRVAACRREGSAFAAELESGETITARSLVIACGGRAGLRFGSTGDGYGFARGFGHPLQPPRPALAGCVIDDPDVEQLKGRVRAVVTLYVNGQATEAAAGEAQFTGYGISGICVMNLTRFIHTAPPRKKKKNRPEPERWEQPRDRYEIGIDFVPELSQEELNRLLMDFRSHAGPVEAYAGVVTRSTAEVLAGLCPEPADAAARLKDWRMPVTAVRGWDEAQVTCGGIRREEINPETMESRLVPGLFFCGEVVDVDGKCGGYNLQWAWSSGAVCGRHAAGGKDA